MDLAIREFYGKIISTINEAQIPVEVKRIIVKDIYTQLDRAANEIITQTLMERNRQVNTDTEAVGVEVVEETAE